MQGSARSCHRFTADVHVLRCIDILDQNFQGKRPERNITSKPCTERFWTSLSYFIVHDIGKDRGPKGHCEREELGKTLMQRLGISEEMHDRVLFVVRNHLEMVRFATIRPRRSRGN